MGHVDDAHGGLAVVQSGDRQDENAGSVSLRHSASAEAIFIGCGRKMTSARRSPVRNTPAVATRMAHALKRVYVR